MANIHESPLFILFCIIVIILIGLLIYQMFKKKPIYPINSKPYPKPITEHYQSNQIPNEPEINKSRSDDVSSDSIIVGSHNSAHSSPIIAAPYVPFKSQSN